MNLQEAMDSLGETREEAMEKLQPFLAEARFNRDENRDRYSVCSKCLVAIYLTAQTEQVIKVGDVIAWESHRGPGAEHDVTIPAHVRLIIDDFDFRKL